MAKGGVGFGLGKAQEVPEALRKATERARKIVYGFHFWKAPCRMKCLGVFGAGRVMLKPASEGTGIIAGGAVRAVMEAVGARMYWRAIGTNNPHNVLRATMQGSGSTSKRNRRFILAGNEIGSSKEIAMNTIKS